jgi:hypothetical protein
LDEQRHLIIAEDDVIAAEVPAKYDHDRDLTFRKTAAM